MTDIFAMPQPGEMMWIGARILVVDVEVHAEAARRLLPPTLELSEPAAATLFVAEYPETAFGSVYNEAAVILHGTDGKGEIGHCPWMVVDEDTALILGRETLGFPKKLADISLQLDGDRAVGTVVRRGEEVLRLEAHLGGVETDPEPILARRGVNLFGSIIGGMRLIELPPPNQEIHESRSAEAKVGLGRTDRDPLGDLRAGTVRGARYVHLDFGSGTDMPKLLGKVDFAWSLPRFLANAL